ncbi:MAG: hypothetical protein SCH70_06800 [Candidatus Methanoperedens sp.]|nr:hypothetical protein [Candidatus Methanoperedens sp.]
MRIYYYRGAICPDCHEPYVNGKPLEILDDVYLRCSSCGAKFRKSINLYAPESFPKTIDYVTKNEDKNANNYLSHIPLVWKINPNIIERAYIDWIRNENEGIFLITWPWCEVRFIPLLVSEYLLHHSDRHVVVIGNYTLSEEYNSGILPSSTPETFRDLLYLENLEPVSPELRNESKKLKRPLIFEKENLIEIRYKKYGKNEIKHKSCYNTLRKCKNSVIREASELSDGFLRELTEPKSDGTKKTTVIDKRGIWDVYLEKQERWTGELHYNKIWLWEILTNNRLQLLSRKIPSYFHTNYEGKNPKDTRLHFLSSEPEINKVFEIVSRISPDILIIENADEIISDSRFMGEKSKALLKFLRECQVRTVLLFSTNPDMRHFYRLNDIESVFQSIKMTPHTWDSAHILEDLQSEKQESGHPNPASSNMIQLKDKIRMIAPDYISLDSHTKLADALERCFERIEGDFKKDMKFFSKRVLTTPLNIKGDYQKPDALSVQKWGGDSLTYDLVISRLYELLDKDTFFSLEGIFKEIFHLDSVKQTNPLREKIIHIVKNILDIKENWHITIVVYPSEIKGTESLIRSDGSIHESAFSHIKCCGWKHLRNIEETIPEGFKHCVISSRYPSIDYNLNYSDVDRFIFIADEKGIGTIKEILDKRLLEINAYPIIRLDEKSVAPALLKDSLSRISIPETHRVKEIYEYVMDDMDYIMPYSGATGSENLEKISPESNTYFKIKTGETVILCIDPQNRGLFIPLNLSVMIKEGYLFQEVLIDENSSIQSIQKQLQEREIILDRSGVYISFRSIFFKYMMRWEGKIHFRKGPYEWIGFNRLFNDSVFWIRLLDNAVLSYAEKHSLTVQQSQSEIARALADSGITASNIEYIARWWSYYEEVTLDSGTYRLYRIERPKSLTDMQTIFKELQKLCPELVPDIQIADRTYAAAVAIQNFRRKSLKRSKEDTEFKYYAIYSQLEKEIKQIIQNADIFKVVSVHNVKVVHEVEPLKIFENYQSFI